MRVRTRSLVGQKREFRQSVVPVTMSEQKTTTPRIRCKEPHWIYIAGTFHSWPLGIMDQLLDRGFKPSIEWWKRQYKFEEEILAVKGSRAFIVCTIECPGECPFVGCYELAEAAKAKNVPIIVYGPEKLASFGDVHHVLDFDALIAKLRAICCTLRCYDE
jgi:hypothetical protein